MDRYLSHNGVRCLAREAKVQVVKVAISKALAMVQGQQNDNRVVIRKEDLAPEGDNPEPCPNDLIRPSSDCIGNHYGTCLLVSVTISNTRMSSLHLLFQVNGCIVPARRPLNLIFTMST